jgi:hypothetical protein
LFNANDIGLKQAFFASCIEAQAINRNALLCGTQWRAEIAGIELPAAESCQQKKDVSGDPHFTAGRPAGKVQIRRNYAASCSMDLLPGVADPFPGPAAKVLMPAISLRCLRYRDRYTSAEI